RGARPRGWQLQDRFHARLAVDHMHEPFLECEQLVDHALARFVAVALDHREELPLLCDPELVANALAVLQRKLDDGRAQAFPLRIRTVPCEIAGESDVRLLRLWDVRPRVLEQTMHRPGDVARLLGRRPRVDEEAGQTAGVVQLHGPFLYATERDLLSVAETLNQGTAALTHGEPAPVACIQTAITRGRAQTSEREREALHRPRTLDDLLVELLQRALRHREAIAAEHNHLLRIRHGVAPVRYDLHEVDGRDAHL